MTTTTRHPARWFLVIVTIAIGVLVGQAVSAQDGGPADDTVPAAEKPTVTTGSEPTIGLVPDTGDRPLRAEDLPDLIPVYGEGDEIIGYARAEEAFVELFDPEQDFVAFGIYEKDGETLIGHEVPGVGFVPGTTPIETSRAAVPPPPLD